MSGSTLGARAAAAATLDRIVRSGAYSNVIVPRTLGKVEKTADPNPYLLFSQKTEH